MIVPETSMPKLSYTWRMRLYYAVGVVATVGLGLTAGTLSRLGEAGEYFWFVYPTLVALASGLGVLAYIWWRALDDVQKAGQTNSWYWGGSAGALLLVLYLVVERAQHSEFGQGAFVMFMAQVVGALLMWVVWRLRGMGPCE